MGTGYLYDIARLVQPVAGLKGTYCGDGDGADVDPLPMSLPDSPAAVVYDGEHPVIAGGWERQTIAVEVAVYVAMSQGLGAAYELARSFKPLLLAAVRAGVTSSVIASLVPLRFRAIEDREWPVDSGNHYYVLILELETKVNVSTTYQPPSP